MCQKEIKLDSKNYLYLTSYWSLLPEFHLFSFKFGKYYSEIIVLNFGIALMYLGE